MKKYSGVFIFIFAGVVNLYAQLSLPDIFTDNMVLQQGKPVRFWGKGVPGNKVRVSFLSEVKETTVASDSTWTVALKSQKAGKTPRRVVFRSGNEQISLKNVVIGDVWLCLGQSNMEWPMVREQHFKEEINNAGLPLLRFYNPGFAGKNVYGTIYNDSLLKRLTPEKFYQQVKWSVSDSSSVKQMSAVGYYFGKRIMEHEGIPVGLVNLAIGGCPIETFINRDVLRKNRRFSAKVKGNWLNNKELPLWIRERGNQNVGEVKAIYGDETGPNHAYKPGFAYESGIAPIVNMPIRGIIWYQGESNAQEPESVREYAVLQELMVKDYRKRWKQPEMPFYWVQLSSIDTMQYKSHLWPRFRNEQRKLLDKIPYSGMAVSSDLGARHDVHPRNKKDVGYRLARWALRDIYGIKVVPSGPLPEKAAYKNNRVVISFKYTAGGLDISGGTILKGFSIDGKTRADAYIKDDKVIIRVTGKPYNIYYGWSPFSKGNLINSEKLPTSSFKIAVK
ncbi:sialate O-acetylesterase [Sinomicrobium sp.]